MPLITLIETYIKKRDNLCVLHKCEAVEYKLNQSFLVSWIYVVGI